MISLWHFTCKESDIAAEQFRFFCIDRETPAFFIWDHKQGISICFCMDTSCHNRVFLRRIQRHGRILLCCLLLLGFECLDLRCVSDLRSILQGDRLSEKFFPVLLCAEFLKALL